MSSSTFAALAGETIDRDKKSGGSGKPKIKLSKKGLSLRITGGRSRHSSGSTYRAGRHGRYWGQRPGRSVSTTGNKFKVVVKVSWAKNGSRAKSRLRATLTYNQDRERADWEERRQFFTKDRSYLDKEDIEREIESKFGKHVAYHSVILSPSDNDVDMKRLVRETMHEWEKEVGYRIEYYAVEHQNTEHHHAHIIIPGSSIDKSTDVKFERGDLEQLREIGSDFIARDRLIDRALDQAIEKEFELSREDRYDLEVQKEFGLDAARYREDQESVGLSTWRDCQREQAELGLGKTYDLARECNKSSKSDAEFLEQLYKEAPSDSDHLAEQQPQDYEDWDRDFANDLYSMDEQRLDLSDDNHDKRQEQQNSDTRSRSATEEIDEAKSRDRERNEF